MDFNIAAGKEIQNANANLGTGTNPVVAPVTSPMKYDSKGSPISTPTAHPTPTPTPQTTSAVALADGTDVPIDAAGAGLPGWVKPTAIGTAGIGVGSIGMNMYNNRNKQRNTY